MKNHLVAGTLLSLVLATGMLGCASKAVSVVEVDQSVLPVSAKTLLPQEAELRKVQKETFSNGEINYVLHYTLDGMKKSIKVNPKDHSSPSGVFDVKLKR